MALLPAQLEVTVARLLHLPLLRLLRLVQPQVEAVEEEVVVAADAKCEEDVVSKMMV